MPVKRRILSCQSCRRLKTRCEVSPGSAQCVRCTTLRLECTLPSRPADVSHVDTVESVTESEQNLSCGECRCSARLDSIEASLSEIKNLMESQWKSGSPARPVNEREQLATNCEDKHRSFKPDSQLNSVTSGVTADRIAPIKVVRELNKIIMGPVTATRNDEILDELSEIGPFSTEFTTALYSGFEQISSRSPFISASNATDLSKRHPLLFVVCLLLGVRTIPGMGGSAFHSSFYLFAKSRLGKEMLNTPLDLSTIQAMLTFSIWSLAPDLRARYIDSWVLSGMTITQCMLIIDSSGLLRATDSHQADEVKEAARTWNVACLVHLKFSVGTGRSLVAESEILQNWAETAEHPGFGPFDRQVVSELKLYILLYKAIFKNSCAVAELWKGIEDWRLRYLTDGDDGLQFAYSCVTLIVARWELTRLHNHLEMDNPDPSHPRIASLIDIATTHAEILLRRTMVLCETTASVKPTFDFLLCAYAGLILVEYSSSLRNLEAAYHLMENVRVQSEISKMVEPVFNWATGVMRKRTMDKRQETVPMMDDDSAIVDLESSKDWIPSLLVDSMNPSLPD